MSQQVIEHDQELEVAEGVEIDPHEERQHVVGGIPFAGSVQGLASTGVKRTAARGVVGFEV